MYLAPKSRSRVPISSLFIVAYNPPVSTHFFSFGKNKFPSLFVWQFPLFSIRPHCVAEEGLQLSGHLAVYFLPSFIIFHIPSNHGNSIQMINFDSTLYEVTEGGQTQLKKKIKFSTKLSLKSLDELAPNYWECLMNLRRQFLG
jgi:hypothetical protein